MRLMIFALAFATVFSAGAIHAATTPTRQTVSSFTSGDGKHPDTLVTLTAIGMLDLVFATPASTAAWICSWVGVVAAWIAPAENTVAKARAKIIKRMAAYSYEKRNVV